jgi:hypothetical protein
MRVLLLQPEDSGRRGPWTRESWDLAIDLGRSSASTAEAWSKKLHCPVVCAAGFSRDIDDVRSAGEILAAADGRLFDDEGLDWWNLRSLEILREAAFVLSLQRLARQAPASAMLWSTRPGWPAAAFAQILGLPLQSYGASVFSLSRARIARQARAARHFSAGQLREIVLDKYDASYRWRARFAAGAEPQSKPVVLIPSAYTNVSRVASAFARLLPEQRFLLVGTRRSARLFEAPANVTLRELSSYAEMMAPKKEFADILQRWNTLSRELQQNPGLALLQRLGMFEHFPESIAQGLAVRDAWRTVLDREPVCGVLCGDDSNVNTRLPVLLAQLRGLPTVDFHHGAMDGFYLAKRLSCDLYLAKSELERDYLLNICRLPVDRVMVGAPVASAATANLPKAILRRPKGNISTGKTAIVFFSEPYDNVGMRTEEIYREVLAPLCAVARASGRGVVLKLHPFESASQRSQVVRRVLPAIEHKHVTVISGPLTEDLLERTWAGVTVESTTVMDCASRGVPCFICEWLSASPFGYMQQYAKFGAGQMLHRVEDIADIPQRVSGCYSADGNEAAITNAGFLWQPVNPSLLAQWLGVESPEPVARPA